MATTCDRPAAAGRSQVVGGHHVGLALPGLERRCITCGLTVGQSGHFDPLDIFDCNEGGVAGPPA